MVLNYQRHYHAQYLQREFIEYFFAYLTGRNLASRAPVESKV
jgi:hypothetical protein